MRATGLYLMIASAREARSAAEPADDDGVTGAPEPIVPGRLRPAAPAAGIDGSSSAAGTTVGEPWSDLLARRPSPGRRIG